MILRIVSFKEGQNASYLILLLFKRKFEYRQCVILNTQYFKLLHLYISKATIK